MPRSIKKPSKSKKPLPGIFDFQLVKVRDLKGKENPLNWKNHTARQKRALRASLAKHGLAGVLLLNVTTDRLIDGHGRLEVMQPEEEVWIAKGRWSEAEERSLLSVLDPIAAMADTDPAALRHLTDLIAQDQETLTNLSNEHQAAFDNILSDLTNHAELVEFGDSPSFFPEEEQDPDNEDTDDEEGETEGTETPVRKASRKIRNSGSNLESSYQLSSETGSIQQYKTRSEISVADWNPVPPFDIPTLRLDRLGSVDSSPGLVPWVPARKQMPRKGLVFYIWGTGTIGINWSRTIINFYTEDRRFESCWNNPDKFTAKLSNAKPYALVAPNFSIWEGTSRAEEIFQVYRTRFVSRYWQEAGFDLIPDIQLGNLWGSDAWNWRFLGIPKGLPCVSVNLQTPGTSKAVGTGYLSQFFSSRKSRLLSALKILKPQQLLIYHGTRLPDSFTSALPKTLDVVLCKSHMSEVIDSRKDSSGKQR